MVLIAPSPLLKTIAYINHLLLHFARAMAHANFLNVSATQASKANTVNNQKCVLMDAFLAKEFVSDNNACAIQVSRVLIVLRN